MLVNTFVVSLIVLIFIGYFFGISRFANLNTTTEKFVIKCASDKSNFGKR